MYHVTYMSFVAYRSSKIRGNDSFRLCPSKVIGLGILRAIICAIIFFFQAEDGIRDWSVTGVPDVCSSDLRFVPSGDVTGQFALVLAVNRPQERSFPMPNSARSILMLGMLAFSPWVLAQGDLGSISGIVSDRKSVV